MTEISTSQNQQGTAANQQRSPASSASGDSIDQYLLQEKIGEGGMGCVYKAVHAKLKKTVAIKVLSTRLTPAVIKRFQKEMEAIGRIEHPNFVRATDAGEDHGRHFLVMDYVEGQDLARILQTRRTLSIAEACAVVCQTAQGLQHLADAKLVHRDIKPSNLLLTPSGQIKILDLGLALLATDLPDEGEELTSPGQAMGTWDYMAPEQTRDSHTVDIRADIYSLGCTFYKVLTGHAPFGGSAYRSHKEKAYAHQEATITPVRWLRPEVPEGVAQVLHKMLAKEPQERYQTPAEVVQALAAFAVATDLSEMLDAAADAAGNEAEFRIGLLAHSSGSADTHRLSGPETSEAGRRGRRGWAVVVGIALVLGGLGLAAALWPRERDDAGKVPNGGGQPVQVREPGLWHSVMNKKPALLRWSKNMPAPVWNEGREEIVAAATDDLGILGLDVIPRDTNYRFRVKLRQNGWTGNVGIIFGYQPGDGVKQAVEFYQAIELVKVNQTLRLDRSHTLRIHAEGGRTKIVAQQTVELPLREEEQLEIEVHGRHLLRVRWAGRDVPDLCTEEVNGNFVEEDYAGALGVLCHNMAVFRDGSVMILER